MLAYIAVAILIILALYFLTSTGQGNAQGGLTEEQQFYASQNVKFVNPEESYIKTMNNEISQDMPHFNTLREIAASDVKGVDYLGIKMEAQTWLFPVSQKHLKQLYTMTNLYGKMASVPFSFAVGYAPEGMPFIKTNEHWKELRKSVAAIFHTDFMNAYLNNFNKAVKELSTKWKGSNGEIIDVTEDISQMAYDSAVYSLIGSKLDVEVGYARGQGEESTLHIRDVNTKTLHDFAKHAATEEFFNNPNYRNDSNTSEAENLVKNMGTLGGALTGLVNARVAEIQGGAEGKTTIVDAAISLTLKGVIKSVGEAVQHGWAILNGAHSNCANALSATLYYLLKNPEKYAILKEEIEKELIKGKTLDETNLNEVLDRDHLKELEYLGYVVKEAFRLSSPIYGKPMQAKEDIQLDDDFVIKKDTIVYPNNGVIGVSENIWKDPYEFIPERFDPSSDYFRLPGGEKREPISWLAFGAGPRVCMGDNYSMYFVKVALVYFIHLFEFEITEELEVDSFFYWLNRRQYSARISNKK